MGKERNQTFQFLKAILIIMVIDDHTGCKLGILTSFFHYDTFFMPLFVAISGYFYRKENIIKNITKKFKKLYVPYLIWSAVGLGLSFILDRLNIVHWYRQMNIRQLYYTLVFAPPTTINGAGWFVVMLFAVSVGYNIVRNIFKDSKAFDYSFLVLSVLLGMASLYLCIHDYNTKITYTVIFRILFYLPFFHFGTMFKKYFEALILKQNKAVFCTACILVNVILLGIFDKDIIFPATSSMNSFKSWWLPYITFVTGGLFWYLVMTSLSEKIGQKKIIDFFADNTFTIMMVHLFFTAVPGFILGFSKKFFGADISWFNVGVFKNKAWLDYYLPSTLKIAALLCGIVGSALTVLIINKSKEKFIKKQEKNL